MKRFLPMIFLLCFMCFAYLMAWHEYLTLENLRRHRQDLLEFVNKYPILAPCIFMAVYSTVVALSIPGAMYLTLTGGFLFAQPMSTLYVLTGASFGAIIIFLIARTTLGESLRERVGPRLEKMESGFQENAIHYLLFLRLVPIFPFFLVNIAPAFFKVPLWTYAWTTVLGILPGVLVFTQAGVALGSLLDSNDPFSLATVLTFEMKLSLCALGLFALMPVLIKKITT